MLFQCLILATLIEMVNYIMFTMQKFQKEILDMIGKKFYLVKDLATGSRVDASRPLPDWTGIEKHQTNRALRALETFGVDPSITREEFFKYKFDVEYSRESILAGVRNRYIKEMEGEEISDDLLPGFELIKKLEPSCRFFKYFSRTFNFNSP